MFWGGGGRRTTRHLPFSELSTNGCANDATNAGDISGVLRMPSSIEGVVPGAHPSPVVVPNFVVPILCQGLAPALSGAGVIPIGVHLANGREICWKGIGHWVERTHNGNISSSPHARNVGVCSCFIGRSWGPGVLKEHCGLVLHGADQSGNLVVLSLSHQIERLGRQEDAIDSRARFVECSHRVLRSHEGSNWHTTEAVPDLCKGWSIAAEPVNDIPEGGIQPGLLCKGSSRVATATDNDGLLVEAKAGRNDGVEGHRDGSSRLARNGDRAFFASEVLDILLDPLESMGLILETEVTVVARLFLCHFVAHKAEYAQTVLNDDYHSPREVGKLLSVEEVQRIALGESTTMDKDVHFEIIIEEIATVTISATFVIIR